jgi:hypothetical protein
LLSGDLDPAGGVLILAGDQVHRDVPVMGMPSTLNSPGSGSIVSARLGRSGSQSGEVGVSVLF